MKYTEESIRLFQTRIEAYLNIWENAKPEDLKDYHSDFMHSPIKAREALNRQYYGNHLSETQVFRLKMLDVQWLRHPLFNTFHRSLQKLIEEFLIEHELYFTFLNTDYGSYSNAVGDADYIESSMNKWERVYIDWEDFWETYDETQNSLEGRWYLHCLWKKGILERDQIKRLVDLDIKALLCANAYYFSISDFKFITDFLLEQGVWDRIYSADPDKLTQ